jgi:hypothetical protein
MKNVIAFLKGKKTYILSGLGALVVFAYFLGFIDYQVLDLLLGLLGFGSLAALRAGVAK